MTIEADAGASTAPEAVAPTARARPSRRRRRLLSGIGVVVVLVAAVVGPATVTRALGPCYADGWRGGQDGEEVPIGQPVEDVAIAGGSVWALGDRAVTRVDPATRTPTGGLSLDAATTGRLLEAGGSLWVTGKGPASVAPGRAAPRLWRVAPATVTLTATVDLGEPGDDIAAVATAGGAERPGLWVLLRRSAAADDRLDLTWVDARTPAPDTVGIGPEGDDRLPGSPWADGVGLATDGEGQAWVEASDRLWRVELDDGNPTVVAGGGGAGRRLGGLTWAAGSLFAVADGVEVVRIDPRTGTRTSGTPLPSPRRAGSARWRTPCGWTPTTASPGSAPTGASRAWCATSRRRSGPPPARARCG
ncbi:MAG: hypothetical protein R2726_03265 [Acidimicrobiales bacterium]